MTASTGTLEFGASGGSSSDGFRPALRRGRCGSATGKARGMLGALRLRAVFGRHSPMIPFRTEYAHIPRPGTVAHARGDRPDHHSADGSAERRLRDHRPGRSEPAPFADTILRMSAAFVLATDFCLFAPSFVNGTTMASETSGTCSTAIESRCRIGMARLTGESCQPAQLPVVFRC